MSAEAAVSKRIREACTDGLEQAVPSLIDIARGARDATPAAQVAAFDRLGKYGVGTRVNVVVTGGELSGLFVRIADEVFRPSRKKLKTFCDLLARELDAWKGDDFGEDPEGDADA